jgi:hypothetical protein
MLLFDTKNRSPAKTFAVVPSLSIYWVEAISSIPAEQDEDATELDKAKVVQRVALITHNEATEGAQPSEEAFDLPAAFVAP